MCPYGSPNLRIGTGLILWTQADPTQQEQRDLQQVTMLGREVPTGSWRAGKWSRAGEQSCGRCGQGVREGPSKHSVQRLKRVRGDSYTGETAGEMKG